MVNQIKIIIVVVAFFLLGILIKENNLVDAEYSFWNLIYGDSPILFVSNEKNSPSEYNLSLVVSGKREKICGFVPDKDEKECLFFVPSGIELEDLIIIESGLDNLFQSKHVEINWSTPTYGEMHFKNNAGVDLDKINFFREDTLNSLFLNCRYPLEVMKADKTFKSDSECRIIDGLGAEIETHHCKVYGHGNTTWQRDEKKSWTIEFQFPTSLLGLDSGYKYVLVSNAEDPTYIRNKFVYDFADKMDIGYTPKAEYINLYINGDFMGNYLLVEKIEVSENRVKLEEDGVLFSTKDKEHETQVFSVFDRDYRIMYPKSIDEGKKELLIKWMEAFQGAIDDDRGMSKTEFGEKYYEEFIDLDSFVQKYLIEAVFKNYDANDRSAYYYIESINSAPLIHAGPIWDYDSILGIGSNASWTIPEGVRSMPPGVDQHLDFMEKAKQTYKKYYSSYLKNNYSMIIKNYVNKIRTSVAMDQRRWPENPFMERDYDVCIDKLLKYFAQRLAYLDRIWIENKKYCRVNFVNEGHIDFCEYVETGKTVDGKRYVPQNSTGLTFVGWYMEDLETKIDFDEAITDNTAFYAQWSK